MIANIANTVVGIGLVYMAVLQPSSVETARGAWLSFVAGAVIIVLAFVSRRSDAGRWFSATNALAGVALLALGGSQALSAAPPLLSFWGVFWVGCIVAVVALWAALYRSQEQAGS
jgi:hypothetical protein